MVKKHEVQAEIPSDHPFGRKIKSEKHVEKPKKKAEKKKTSHKKEKSENIIAFAVIAVIILFILGFWNSWWGIFDSKENADSTITRTSILNEPVKGNPDAPITIVEYSDFQCPFCGRWLKEVYPLIDEAYIKTGKAKLVFKQFPLTRIHEHAVSTAIASECAFRQGNDFFWQYHDKLYENQDALDSDSLKQYAEGIGLNALQFDLCFSNKDTEPEVNDDLRTGSSAGITGTPGFVIGKGEHTIEGELVIGAHPFTKFSEVISRLE